MFVGPIFFREAATAPRQVSFYAYRTVFVIALFGLLLTAWQLLIGSRRLESPGELASFGAAVFQILAPLQLAVAVPFSALLAASAVAQEKDRQTLILLLMTRLTNQEVVVGKLLASMLIVIVVLIAALPLFMLCALLGGVSHTQIARVLAVTTLSAVVAGSLGSTVALWRDKTFQSLALTALVLSFWLAAWQGFAAATESDGIAGMSAGTCQTLAVAMSPWLAVRSAASPSLSGELAAAMGGVDLFLLASAVAAAALNGLAILMVRRWNPSRQARETPAGTSHAGEEATPFAAGAAAVDGHVVGDSAAAGTAGMSLASQADSQESAATVSDSQSVVLDREAISRRHSAGGRVRRVWDNPVLWREICTWAYGKKILVVRFAYVAMFLACLAALIAIVRAGDSAETFGDPIAISAAESYLPLLLSLVLLVSLVLLNAQAVTSLTNERDGRALDLLLATDLSPKEIIFGKLGGTLYNAKETILLPLLACVYLWFAGLASTENAALMMIGLLVLVVFAATLGLHVAMTYANSRTAIATSLGTILFLFLGVAVCMRIMLAFSESFHGQLASFAFFMAGGGIALYVALSWRMGSAALALATVPAPFVSFVAITSYLLGQYLTVFFLLTLTYGFATAAMLIPAIHEFDVATGRTVAREAG